jgi:hypothetical protein
VLCQLQAAVEFSAMPLINYELLYAEIQCRLLVWYHEPCVTNAHPDTEIYIFLSY